MEKKLLGYSSRRDGELFLLCWIAYTSTYICRLNFSAIIPELTSGDIMSESRIASISSIFFVCYGLGQLFSGIIGDKLNTRIMVFQAFSYHLSVIFLYSSFIHMKHSLFCGPLMVLFSHLCGHPYLKSHQLNTIQRAEINLVLIWQQLSP